MKVLLVCLLLGLGAGDILAQRVPSSCTAPDSVMQLYRADAAFLAIGYLSSSDPHFRADSVRIWQTAQELMMSDLMTVYNSGLRSADTILGRIFFRSPYYYDIGPREVHNHDTTQLRILSVEIDTSIGWQRNLFLNITPTGLRPIDSLIDLYHLRLDTANLWSYNIFLITPEYMNLLALAHQWDLADGNATRATPGRWYGGGDVVSFEHSDSADILHFVYGWEDCPAGCLVYHDWPFAVYEGCSVQALPSEGSEMYLDEVRVSADRSSTLSMFPDPATNLLTIETRPLAFIEIVSLEGVTVHREKAVTDHTQVSLAGLAAGQYVVRVTDSNGVVQTGKFVKQ